MPRKVSRNRHEDYIDHFPGTAEEKQSFQEWLKQIPWLHPDHVTLWFAEEMDVYLSENDGNGHYSIIREALCHIAIDIQNVIASSLCLSGLPNLIGTGALS
jgi:hypothetical protein